MLALPFGFRQIDPLRDLVLRIFPEHRHPRIAGGLRKSMDCGIPMFYSSQDQSATSNNRPISQSVASMATAIKRYIEEIATTL